MQLLGPGSDEPWINNDWHIAGTKNVSVFCGIWDDDGYNNSTGIMLQRKTKQDHWGWFLRIGIWRFELTIDLYDSRHWNDISNKPINTKEDADEYEAQCKEDLRKDGFFEDNK